MNPEPGPLSLMTLREALALAFSEFNGLPDLRPEAREEATCLLLHVLSISRATLLTSYDRILSTGEAAAYRAAINRRLTNEPVQYITGEREFYGLPLHVSPAVLIPRNLTEHLVEAVLEALRPRDQAGERLQIADVGTGSGAIAIALAVHLPNAQLTALDLSPAALAVAQANAGLNQVAARIRFLKSDLLGFLESDPPASVDLDRFGGQALEPPFDAIISNPPYIPTADRDTLHPQVRDYEPSLALYAGLTGLDIYRRLIPQAFAALKPHGLFAAEIGPGQVAAITSLLAVWSEVHFANDLEGVPRIVLARKP